MRPDMAASLRGAPSVAGCAVEPEVDLQPRFRPRHSKQSKATGRFTFRLAVILLIPVPPSKQVYAPDAALTPWEKRMLLASLVRVLL